MEQSDISIVARYMAKAPVDLKSILAELGVAYEEVPMDGASGAITCDGGRFRVSVNSLESENRRRFTAAHELAHYLLHRDLMSDGKMMHRHVDTLYGGGQPDELIFKRSHEIQANRLAAQIIMPVQLVNAKHELTSDAGSLAKEFGVSKAAMEIRLKTLGLAA